MGKLISNCFALVNGFRKATLTNMFTKWSQLKHDIRLFYGAELHIYNKSKCSLGHALRIDKHARVVCVNDASMHIGNNVAIGINNCIICRNKITIGDGTIMGPGVMIYDHDHLFSSTKGVSRNEYSTGEVFIGKNCWIGAQVVILKDTHIEDNCIIGAGSIVKGHIPYGSIYVQKRQHTLKGVT